MKTILFVEDYPPIQDAMQFVFEGSDFDLIVCSELEKIISDNSLIPDIYLIDKQLSGFDGIELCRLLKANEKTKNVPVIMLSASPNIVEIAEKAGADWAFKKPFNVTFLIEKINQLLANE